jgi:hypothetical protein
MHAHHRIKVIIAAAQYSTTVLLVKPMVQVYESAVLSLQPLFTLQSSFLETGSKWTACSMALWLRMYQRDTAYAWLGAVCRIELKYSLNLLFLWYMHPSCLLITSSTVS